MAASATCAIDKGPTHCVFTDSYEYDAFGNHWTAEGTTPNNMLYRGEQYDLRQRIRIGIQMNTGGRLTPMAIDPVHREARGTL